VPRWLRLLFSRNTGTHQGPGPLNWEGAGGRDEAGPEVAATPPARPWPVPPAQGRIGDARRWLASFPAPLVPARTELRDAPPSVLAILARQGWDAAATLDAALRACEEREAAGGMRWHPEA
jgi:hypothetical protein